jgi:predicted GIY-YIG superfamily endonuclease
MNTTGNKQGILYVVTNKINGLKYFGVVYKPGKTIHQRFEDHATGKGGKFLYEAILEFGVENFEITEVERGDLEYIFKREIEETSKTLYMRGAGYNGNCGKCIILNDEMISKRNQKINQEARMEKWKKTFEQNKGNHNYSKTEETLNKIEIANYSQIRGKTKNESERLLKLSISNKQRWDNPTEKMIEGKLKSIETNKNKTPEEKQLIIQKQLETKKTKRMNGEYMLSSPYSWHTPIGVFKDATAGATAFGIGYSTFKTWCKKNKQILKRHHKFNDKIPHDWDNKFTKDIGFYFIKDTKSKMK